MKHGDKLRFFFFPPVLRFRCFSLCGAVEGMRCPKLLSVFGKLV